MTGKIAWAHVKEFPNYYTRLVRRSGGGRLLGFATLNGVLVSLPGERLVMRL